MADKKENIPSITPAQDEVASYRRSGRLEAPRQSNFNGLLVFVIALMVIVMGFGGYTLYEVQGKLERSNKLLAEGQNNIRQLESRLAVTGTDVSRTLQDIKEQVNTNFSEIDKLWAVSLRQNKPDIQKNVRTIASTRDDLRGRIDKVNVSVQQLAARSQSILDDLTIFRTGIQNHEELVTEFALLRGQVQDQVVEQEALKRSLNALTQRLQETEEAIGTIDKHRQILSQKIQELQTEEKLVP